MLTIACVFSGGKYGLAHVERLKKIIRIKQPYRFTCVDDSIYPGWWAKIDLFKPGRFSGRVLYLDLDVDIVGDLDEIAEYPVPFGIIKDWNGAGANSSVMVWDAGVVDHLYTQFTPDVMNTLRGDQDWINRKMLGRSYFPQPWCLSYKTNIRPTEHMPDSAKVIVYHGAIKPWDL